jgi:2-keto-4-pentenoate hydratase/2-oxohepta-3-ene-1,7-dioic acid hydratase in catechol pathway
LAEWVSRRSYLVSYISQGITLEPGDMIGTSTPDGVGIFCKLPVLLKAGDVFEASIEKLGHTQKFGGRGKSVLPILPGH